jgi:hypothetical protein
MTDNAQDFREWTETVGRWQMHARSYKLGDEYICVVDNVSPGATLVRLTAPTREEVETQATEQAKRLLDSTRVVDA